MKIKKKKKTALTGSLTSSLARFLRQHVVIYTGSVISEWGAGVQMSVDQVIGTG